MSKSRAFPDNVAKRWLLAIAVIAVFCVLPARGRKTRETGATPGVVVPGAIQLGMKQWKVPVPNAKLQDAFSRGDFVWYSAAGANLLGRFDPATDQFKEFHLRPGSNPGFLVPHAGSGVQGTVFFVSRTAGFIGDFDPKTGEVHEFRIVGPKRLLQGVTFDRNGAVWFTVSNARPPRFPRGSEVGSLNVFSYDIRLARTPTPNAGPYDLAISPRDIPFFTEMNSPRLGSVDPVTMKITEYRLPNAKSRPRGLTFTPDGALWYTDTARGYLGRFDPAAGRFEEWPSPSGPRSRPFAIAHVGQVIWYTETGTKPNMLVRFDPATRKFQSWKIPGGGGIRRLYAGSGGSLWFANPKGNSIVHVTTGSRGN